MTDPPVDLARFRARRLRDRLIAALDGMAAAAARRDVSALFGVLSAPDMRRHLPREVREELLAIARLPAGHPRAPVRLFHYRHTLQQLGDEPLVTTDADEPPVLDDAAPTPVVALPRRLPGSDGPPPGGAPSRRSGPR